MLPLMNLLKPMLLLMLLFPVGCDNDDLNCGNGVPRYTDVIGITGYNARLLTDNYRKLDSLAAQAQATFAQYALQLSPTVELTDQRAEITGGWGNAAYACDPVPPKPFETITDIALFSNTAYEQASSDKVIAAGERLNDIVKIYDYYSGRIVGLPDFLLDEPLAGEEGFLLQLTTAPAQETIHTFTVRYELDNGETYEFTALPVTLTP